MIDNGGTTARLGDFKDGHSGNGDYSFDVNGNLKKDLNKGIGSITYNHLNLPEQVTFTGKGNIKFVYDAAGNKLQKIVTDNTTSPAKTTVTNYISGFVYQYSSPSGGGQVGADTLQFFPTEEGRVRYVPAHGSTAAAYVYDYFLKDHLGNTRLVLTEQTDFSQYLATMEQPEAQTEDALFYDLNSTREPKPVDYPQDNITTPNKAVAKLNGKDPDKRIGPSIILKVMAGDTIQAAVRAYYKEKIEPKKKATIPAEQMLAELVQSLVAPESQVLSTHSTRLVSNPKTTVHGLTANDLQSLRQKDPNNKQSDKPKAYLNYVFFDKQLNFVEEGSGVKQVDGEAGKLETLSSGKVVAKENGYVYVFTSNESSQDVLFDNFGVTQITGPVLEETHYYPFGLTMAGISTTAPLKLEAKRKFNGIDFNHKEFSDGSGLELYTARFRDYDPQVGRWNQIDPRPNMNFSPYAGMRDNPMFFRDFLGDTTVPIEEVWGHWSNFNTRENTIGLNTFEFTACDYGHPSTFALYSWIQLQQRQDKYFQNLISKNQKLLLQGKSQNNKISNQSKFDIAEKSLYIVGFTGDMASYSKFNKLANIGKFTGYGVNALGFALDIYNVSTSQITMKKFIVNTSMTAYGLAGSVGGTILSPIYGGFEAFYPGGFSQALIDKGNRDQKVTEVLRNASGDNSLIFNSMAKYDGIYY